MSAPTKPKQQEKPQPKRFRFPALHVEISCPLCDGSVDAFSRDCYRCGISWFDLDGSGRPMHRDAEQCASEVRKNGVAFRCALDAGHERPGHVGMPMDENDGSQRADPDDDDLHEWSDEDAAASPVVEPRPPGRVFYAGGDLEPPDDLWYVQDRDGVEWRRHSKRLSYWGSDDGTLVAWSRVLLWAPLTEVEPP